MKKSIAPILVPYRNIDNSLTEKDFEKLINHYGLGIGGFLSTLFCLLRGTKLSEQERWAITAQGAITGLFDDLIDHANHPETEIKSLFALKENKPNINARESLMLKFHDIIHENSYFPEKTAELERKIFELQIESRKQLGASIGQEKLKHIILAKGGTAVLYFRSVLINPCLEAERQLCYLLGQTSQVGSDIFDLYKDKTEGVNTLMTSATDVCDMYYLFGELLSKTLRATKNASHSQKGVRYFNRAVSFFMTRTFVCLKGYLSLQKATNNTFQPELHTRKELICDMEKPKNLLISFYYYLKTSV